jgi:hypothetical protein
MVDPLAAILVFLVVGRLLATAAVVQLWIVAAISILAIVSLSQSKRLSSLASLRSAPIAVLFALGVLGVILTATPWAPGGVHPLWAFVGVRGGAALDREATGFGLLQLFGLAFAFMIAREGGRQAGSSRTAIWTLLLSGGALGLWVLGERLVTALGLAAAVWGGVIGPGEGATIFGALVILAFETLLSSLRHQGGSSLSLAKWRRPPVALACLALLIAVGALCALAPLPAILADGVLVALFIALGAVSGSGFERGPRWIRGGLAIAFVVLAATAALAVFAGGRRPALQALTDDAHLSAFAASPLSGYGLGTLPALSPLIMTRANLDALTTYPLPDNSYLIWALEGGLLCAIPLLGAVAWALGLSLMGSLRPRARSGLTRACVCSIFFLLLDGAFSAAPSALGVEAFAALLLGLGVGASEI